MDSLTEMIAHIDIPLVTAIALLFDNELVMFAITLALVVATERRRDKVAKILVAMACAIAISMVVKPLVHIERPCLTHPAKVACHDDFSFPSGHTLLAFTVMLAFLNKPTFAFFMVYAIFIAFTRIYLGLHSLEDVAGSIALAPFAYYLSELIWNKLVGGRHAFRDKTGQ